MSVSSSTVKGAVGDIVPIAFTITSKHIDCANYQVHLQANDSAYTHLLFTGTGKPSLTLHEEHAAYWKSQEIHTSDSLTLTAYAKIVDGTVGKTISGFDVRSGCGLYDHYSVTDGTPAITVIEKSITPTLTATPKATTIPISKPVPLPTATPTSQPSKLQYVSPATPTVIPTAITINPIDPDGDGLPTDQEAIWGSNPYIFDTDSDGMPDGDEIRNGSNPVGNVPPMSTPTSTPIPSLEIEQGLYTLPPQESILNTFIKTITKPFRVIGEWFAGLF